MNVLLIAYHYPPDPAVGGIRARKVVAALRSAGHDVTVFAAPVPEGIRSGEADEGVQRIPVSLDPRRIYSRLKTVVRLDTDGPQSEQAWTPPENPPAWKRLVSSLIWLPDDRQGWIAPVVWRALWMRPRPHLVYTTAPPFSAHVAGLIHHVLRGTQWVAEFRDPWTENPWKPPHVRSGFSDRAERWLENATIRNARTVVAVTERAADRLRERLPERHRGKVLLIRNGIDELAGALPGVTGSGFRIVHIGSIYHRRDPRPFFDTLARLRASSDLPEGLQVEMIGSAGSFNGVDLREYTRGGGLEGIVRFPGSRSHSECQEAIRNADLLLLLAQGQPAQVPTKLYEYLGARRPILAYLDADGESAELLRRTGRHYLVCSDDPEENERVVREALANRGSPAVRGDDDFLHDLQSSVQMDRLMNALEDRP